MSNNPSLPGHPSGTYGPVESCNCLSRLMYQPTTGYCFAGYKVRVQADTSRIASGTTSGRHVPSRASKSFSKGSYSGILGRPEEFFSFKYDTTTKNYLIYKWRVSSDQHSDSTVIFISVLPCDCVSNCDYQASLIAVIAVEVCTSIFNLKGVSYRSGREYKDRYLMANVKVLPTELQDPSIPQPRVILTPLNQVLTYTKRWSHFCPEWFAYVQQCQHQIY